MRLALSEIRTDGGTQPRAQLDGVTVSEYADAMRRGDDFPPVRVMHDGENYWLYDGFHRVQAARQIGREEIGADVEQGTKEDAQWASLAANKRHGLRRSQADKRRAIKRALKGWGEEKSKREIARHVGCSDSTVRRVAERCAISAPEKVEGKDGKMYPSSRDTSDDGPDAAEKESAMQPEGGTTLKERAERGRERAQANGQTPEDALSDKLDKAAQSEPTPGLGGPSEEHHGNEEDEPANVHVSNNSGDPEWYTPPKYVDAAREVLGTIELDPASSAQANEHVEAEEFYDEDDDGLQQPWSGRVWMNPPYADGLVGPFCRKLCGMHERGDVPEAIVLVNNATETKWFQHTLRHADAVCFPKGRIRYINPDREETNSPLQGQAFIYLGDAPGHFADVFDKFGEILCP